MTVQVWFLLYHVYCFMSHTGMSGYYLEGEELIRIMNRRELNLFSGKESCSEISLVIFNEQTATVLRGVLVAQSTGRTDERYENCPSVPYNAESGPPGITVLMPSDSARPTPIDNLRVSEGMQDHT
jgi:hypothetical protein